MSTIARHERLRTCFSDAGELGDLVPNTNLVVSDAKTLLFGRSLVHLFHRLLVPLVKSMATGVPQHKDEEVEDLYGHATPPIDIANTIHYIESVLHQIPSTFSLHALLGLSVGDRVRLPVFDTRLNEGDLTRVVYIWGRRERQQLARVSLILDGLWSSVMALARYRNLAVSTKPAGVYANNIRVWTIAFAKSVTHMARAIPELGIDPQRMYVGVLSREISEETVVAAYGKWLMHSPVTQSGEAGRFYHVPRHAATPITLHQIQEGIHRTIVGGSNSFSMNWDMFDSQPQGHARTKFAEHLSALDTVHPATIYHAAWAE